jgi:flagellar basal body rod protein FlgG
MGSGDEFGLNAAASGLEAAQNTLTIWANNLANQSTPGFEAAIPEPVTGPVATAPALLGSGTVSAPSGVSLAPSLTNVAQGPLVNTGNPSDLALTVPGYFPVRTPAGILLTRNGAFSRDASGQLVSPGGGVLLGLNLKPIVVPPGNYAVANGTVTAENGTVVGQLAVATVPNPDGLLNVGGSLLAPSPASGPIRLQPALGQDIVQGQLEGANVSLPSAMSALVLTQGEFVEMTTVVKAAQQLSQITNGLAVLP